MKGGAANRSTVITAKQVQYLQTIRRQMGIDDELYEEMKAAIGAKSTRELTNAQFDQLLARLRGRKGKSPGKARPAAYKPVHPSAYASGMHLRPPEDVAGMISKIEAILTELKLPWSYVDGMARKMCGVDKLRWCDAAQIYTILQALCVYQRRRRARESGE